MVAVGRVFLVGAGPGDPGLLTLKGARALGLADTVIYDGLANVTLLSHAQPHARRLYAGEKRGALGGALSQPEIVELLLGEARAGRTVVRLKGGDPFVFGRGCEEVEALVSAGISFEIVPGVTAATAVPAYAGIPITSRDVASSVLLATGSAAQGVSVDEILDFECAKRADTVVLFMAVTSLGHCAARLIQAGRASSTPVAVIRWGTTARQSVVTGTLLDIAERVTQAEIAPPALVVIGDVVEYRERFAWAESRTMHGRRVLFTRDAEKGARFAVPLEDAGAEVVFTPVQTLRALPGDEVGQAMPSLPWTDAWVVLTSRGAVDFFAEALRSAGKDVRVLGGTRLAAVGETTARALRERGFAPDRVPSVANGMALAKALGDVAGQRVIWPRQTDARPELTRALEEQGARVEPWNIYQGVPATADELAPMTAELAAKSYHAVVCFAPSQVHALAAAAGTASLRQLRLVAIGPTTAAAFEELGLTTAAFAASPTPESLLLAVRAALISQVKLP